MHSELEEFQAESRISVKCHSQSARQLLTELLVEQYAKY